MIRKSTIAVATAAAAFATLLAGVSEAWAEQPNEEDEVPLAQLPTAVQETMRRVAGAALPDEFDKTVENGALVYQGEYRTATGENSIKVAASGELLEVRKEMAVTNLPAAVGAAIAKKYTPTARIKKAGGVYLKGASELAYYDVKVVVGSASRRIKVRPTGEIVS
ncbi:MAG: hypothetical protein QOI66_1532 [Myxococcales bacterium]|jgi:hypothetical protein|nr:hypothetical protein [Myxococcales bacterium]